MDLSKNVQFIKGVGEARAKLLNRLGIYTLQDLIEYYPREHEDRSVPKKIAELVDGEEALVEGFAATRVSEIRIRRNMTLLKLNVRDETGMMQITWFNQPYIKQLIKPGMGYKFFGKVSKKGSKIEMNSPVFDMEETNKNTGKIIPIYPSTYKMPQTTLRRIIETGLNEVNGKLPETMPEYLISKYKLSDINEATYQIHFPSTFEDFNKARKRLVFEELLSMQLALLALKNQYTLETKGIKFPEKVQMSDVINDLPFKLTKAQLRVLEEIDKDMEKEKPMNRLLQGDVGSGKTVVAEIAAYKCVKSGYQAAIMAPTAILASQHLESFTNIFKGTY